MHARRPHLAVVLATFSAPMLALALYASRASAQTTVPPGPVGGQTWTSAGSPYLVAGDITIPAGQILTIQAGVEVRLGPGDASSGGLLSNRTELTVDGTLSILGTGPQQAWLHSSGSAGAWYGIVVTSTATMATISHVSIEDAIYGVRSESPTASVSITDAYIGRSLQDAVYVAAGSTTIQRVTLTGAGDSGLHVVGTGNTTVMRSVIFANAIHGLRYEPAAATMVSFDHVTFWNNSSGPIRTQGTVAGAVSVRNSILAMPAANYPCVRRFDATATTLAYTQGWFCTDLPNQNPLWVSPNTPDMRLTSNSPARFQADDGTDIGALPYDGVPTPGWYGTLWTDTTFTSAGSPYTIGSAGVDLTVAPGRTLTIEPGVTVNTPGNTTYFLWSRGNLIARGTPAAPITIGPTVIVRRAPSGATFELEHVNFPRSSITIEGTAPTLLRDLSFDGGHVGLWEGSHTIERARFANRLGTAIDVNGSLILINVTFRDVYEPVYHVPTVANTTLTVDSCTLVGQPGSGTGISIYGNGQFAPATTTISRTIILGYSSGVLASTGGNVTVHDSDVWGASTASFAGQATYNFGPNILSINPQLVSASDLHLSSASVCIDVASTGPALDLDRNARPFDGDGDGTARFDLGAYEFGGITNPIDAGVPDASIPDASTPDADGPDASIPDAGTPDAAVPDGAAPDASVPDAGVPDADTVPDAAGDAPAVSRPPDGCGCRNSGGASLALPLLLLLLLLGVPNRRAERKRR